jgi:hypothetical protein
LALFVNQAIAVNVGFNQAWFKNHYSSQYLDSSFDPHEVDRIFKLTKAAGSETIRLWFFESSSFPMIHFKRGEMVGLKDEYIKNVITTIRLAKANGLKIYMTIFDAHNYRPDQLSRTELQKFRKLFQPSGMDLFLRKIISPLFNAIEEEKLSSVLSKIDLINEGDTVIKRGGFDGGWKGMSKMLCQWKSFLKDFSGFHQTPITMSIRLHPLLPLPLNLLKDNGPMKCADIIDFHSYDDDGDIYRCAYLKKYSKLQKKQLILGEFGQNYFTHRYSDSLQIKNTQNFINNANRCGFSEALAWRLSDVRDGVNQEARYSFEAFEKMRPAYFLIQKNNLHK